MTRYRERYQEIYDLLTRVELQKGSQGLDELSAAPDLFGYDTDLWLGFYTREGLEMAFERYGFLTDLHRLGFEDFRLETKTDDPDEHMLRLWSVRPEVDEPLIELVVRRNFLRATDELAERVEHEFIPVLSVEWLMLQNPVAPFSPRRPPLPGQHHPGLGVGSQVLEMLRNVCLRLKLGGITTVPSYFHNAVFYSNEFRHFDPHCQGAFLAMCRDVIPRTGGSVAAASWALNWKMVRNLLNEDEDPYPWFQELMVMPLAEPLQRYFSAREYQRDVQHSLTHHSFEVYESALRQTLEAKGIMPLKPERVRQWVTLQP